MDMDICFKETGMDATAAMLNRKAVEAINRVAEAIAEMVKLAIDSTVNVITKWWNAVLKAYAVAVHPKWWHYYTHTKKKRTRKKYHDRICRELLLLIAECRRDCIE